MSISQVSPSYPASQMQVNELIPSMHSDWLETVLHGLKEHSLISNSQSSPSNPASQLHSKWVPRLRQVLISDMVLHGSESQMSISQIDPLYAAGHSHWKSFSKSMQRPSLRHGFEEHSSISTSHNSPS